jgi:hypothetical protein
VASASIWAQVADSFDFSPSTVLWNEPLKVNLGRMSALSEGPNRFEPPQPFTKKQAHFVASGIPSCVAKLCTYALRLQAQPKPPATPGAAAAAAAAATASVAPTAKLTAASPRATHAHFTSLHPTSRRASSCAASMGGKAVPTLKRWRPAVRAHPFCYHRRRRCSHQHQRSPTAHAVMLCVADQAGLCCLDSPAHRLR